MDSHTLTVPAGPATGDLRCEPFGTCRRARGQTPKVKVGKTPREASEDQRLLSPRCPPPEGRRTLSPLDPHPAIPPSHPPRGEGGTD